MIHDGHRIRLRQKYKQHGFDSFEKHELLEFLLFYSIGRKDTNELGHSLIEKFGSFSAALDAPIEAIKEINGIGDHSATLIKLIPQLCRCYMQDKDEHKHKIIDVNNAPLVFINRFIGRQNEAVMLMLLDSKCKSLFCGVINEGSVNSVDIYIRKIVELAITYNASMALLAHNHPSGIACPSSNDIETTVNVRKALDIVDVKLVDHIIVADNDAVSMAQSKLKDYVFDSIPLNYLGKFKKDLK